MTNIEYRLSDLINFSSNQKPIEFETAFKDLLTGKVEAAINDKKVDIAQSMFNPSIDVSDENEQETESEEEELNA